jgi:carbonic anhydrase/acetyltransferase-like protein (isoleucine patch superfamily)
MLYEFEGYIPKISKTAYVHPTAIVIGNVELKDHVFIAPGAIVRGDYGTITIDENSAIEDNCVIHARPKEATRIGKYVTAGHSSVIHTATVKDYAVIGIKAVIADYSVIGTWAVVAEGAVVKKGQNVPDEKIVFGVPAEIKGIVSEEYKKQWLDLKNIYVSFTERYKTNLKKIE